MRKLLFIVCFLLSLCMLLAQPKPMRLWKEVRGMKHHPSKLYVYPAPDSLNTGIAVIVCPGGSYSHTLGIATEGFGVAQWLNSHGINAFVLKYRVGSQGYHHPAMIEDAQYTIHYVRQHAKDYHIDPNKLGTMGFSAGGHLVAMTGALAQENFLAKFNIDTTLSLRPNFVVPVYPVVSMQDDIVHKRSRRNLLSRHYSEETQQKFSLELNIPPTMPPTFVVTAKDDPVVNYQNSVRLDQALSKAHIPHQFFLYKTGGHGYGADEMLAPEAGKWKYEFIPWLNTLFAH